MLYARYRLALLTLVFLLLLTLVYNHFEIVAEQTELLTDSFSDGLTWLAGHIDDEQRGLLLVEGMQSWLDHPLDPSDFAKKGDRVKAVAGLMRIVQEHETSKLKAALSHVLESEYPWWLLDNDEYRPWEKSWLYPGHDTGIVICTSSQDIMVATQLIQILRNVFGSKLPIDIAYAGDTDLFFQHRSYLRNLGSNIQTLNVLDHFNESYVGLVDGKYALKPFAVLASRFPRVILLDADTVPLQSPDNVLQRFRTYNETGLLYFHDRAYRTQDSRREWISEKLHFRNLSTTLTSSLYWREGLWEEMASGLLAIDKTRPEAFMTLLFAAWMNTKSVRDQETYPHVLGDEETYWLAAEFARLPYAFVPEYAGIIGTVEDGHDDRICSTHMAHMDETGVKPLWFANTVMENNARQDSKVGGLDEFKNIMLAGREMKDMPRWEYQTDDLWCAEGKEAQNLAEDRDFGELMQRILKEAEKVTKDLEANGLLE